MNRVFERIYYLIRRKRSIFLLLLATLLTGCFFIISKIKFNEDISHILPKGEKTDITAKVMQQLDFSDKIVVMMTAKDGQKEKLPEMANYFLDALKNDSVYIQKIEGNIDSDEIEQTFSFVYNHLPLFLDSSDYLSIEKRLNEDSIHKKMEENYHTLISPSGIVLRDFILNDPLGLSFIGLTKLRKLNLTSDFILNDGFVHAADTSTLLLFISPTFSGTDNEHNEKFVNHLYKTQEEINRQFHEIGELTYFGAPFISVANANQIKKDIQRTVLISLLVLMLILIFFFRKIYVPILLFIPAFCGVSIAMAILYFVFPFISAISIGIGAILLGITIDYPLHIITHYRQHNDVHHLFQNITMPVLSSSGTTAVAFLCLFFVNSEVLQILGMFAALSIFLSSVFALLIIPQLLNPKEVAKPNIIDRIAAHKYEKNKALVILTLLVVFLGIMTFSKVQFNNDISALNFVPDNMKASERQLDELGSLGAKSIYISLYGYSPAELVNENNLLYSELEQLQKDNKILSFSSIGEFLMSSETQLKKMNEWNRFWEDKKEETTTEINTSAQELGFNQGAFDAFSELLNTSFSPIQLEEFKSLKALPIDEFFAETNGFYTLSSIVQIDSTQRNEVLRSLDKFNVITIDRKHLNEQFLGQIKDDFKSLINYSYLAVLIILLLFFRRIELAIVSIVPITLTGLVTLGIVYLFGLELNIFSSVVTTLILGLGVDFSVFLTSGLQMRYTTGIDEIKTYRTSILLAILTTILAVGVLIFAKHPALTSISAISNIGLLVALIITFALYPLLFRFLFERRVEKGKSPVTLRLVITAILSHAYYAISSLLYALFGILFIRLFPLKKEKKLQLYRKGISVITKSVMYSNYGVKNIVLNPHKETFEKPAIIIANHSSFLDTLTMGFLSKKIIFLVNDWVYHSPIFGKVVKLAGYFPVSQGIENGEEELVQRIKEGYSLVVFPEGTRSENGSIARFRKGAFDLAQRHHIDILPVYIHGNADLLPKGDFIIFDGTHTIEIGKRITFDECMENITTKEITKRINGDFRIEFQKIRDRIENEDYFAQKIGLNFLYKTKDIVKLAKKEFETNKENYYKVNKFIDSDKTILRIGNDLGIWDLMLTLQQAQRKVVTFIQNEEFRNVAKQSYLVKKRKIKYTDKVVENDTDTLLITSIVEENILIKVLNQDIIQKIIDVSEKENTSIYTKFGFSVLSKDGKIKVYGILS